MSAIDHAAILDQCRALRDAAHAARAEAGAACLALAAEFCATYTDDAYNSYIAAISAHIEADDAANEADYIVAMLEERGAA